MSSSTSQDSSSSVYVAPGMPPLDMSGNQTSFFEFWPTWVIYIPVVLQSLALALWHRSLTLPLIANPKLPLSGMVGIGKSELLSQATGDCEAAILDWFLHTKSDENLDTQAAQVEAQMSELGLAYPVVCKPDIGCRGAGVKLVRSREQLLATLEYYPFGSGMLVQKLADWEPEAGVFYVREPNSSKGKIISLALKYTPYVVGDGKRSLRELIEGDVRAGNLTHLYLERHKPMLDKVIEQGRSYRLVFSASHCRGAIFRDANVYISGELEAKIDEIMQDIPEFHYGRLDIKFENMEGLSQGKGIQIIEINSASSEPLHIWDRQTSLGYAISSLLYQYRALFKLGAQNRGKGYRTPKFSELLQAWKIERNLTKAYPETD